MPICRVSILLQPNQAFDFGNISFVDDFMVVIDRDYPEFWNFLPRYVNLTEEQIWKYRYRLEIRRVIKYQVLSDDLILDILDEIKDTSACVGTGVDPSTYGDDSDAEESEEEKKEEYLAIGDFSQSGIFREGTLRPTIREGTLWHTFESENGGNMYHQSSVYNSFSGEDSYFRICFKKKRITVEKFAMWVVFHNNGSQELRDDFKARYINDYTLIDICYAFYWVPTEDIGSGRLTYRFGDYQVVDPEITLKRKARSTWKLEHHYNSPDYEHEYSSFENYF